MHTVFALLCFVVVIHWLIFPYSSGLLHWHCGNLTIAPVPAKQPWWIWINTSCEFIMNDCITTTKQSTTKPCAYFLGYTVFIIRQWHGNTFRITVPLNKFTSYQCLSLKRTSNELFWSFLCCQPEQGSEQTSEMLVIWDIMTFMWHHCDVESLAAMIAFFQRGMTGIRWFLPRYRSTNIKKSLVVHSAHFVGVVPA